MTWQIRIPYRDRSDPISELGFDARHLDNEDDAAVARQLAMDAIGRHETVGEFLDELEQLGAADRRRRFDDVRQRCGLETTTELDRRREQRRIDARFEQHDIPGPEPWSEWHQCPGPGCRAIPQEDGRPIPTSLHRWHCAEHRHLAQPGDLEEHQSAYIGIGMNGRLIPSEREAARIAAEVRKRDEPREREQREREEHLAAEAAALDEVRRKYEETAEISVAGVRVHPDGRLVNP